MEFPGSGESSMSGEPLEVEGLCADAVALMDHLGCETFDVAGYSLGAVVALSLAAQHPGRVSTVTSLCGWAVTDARMRLTFDLWSRLISVGPELFMRYALVDGYTAEALTAIEPMADAVVSMASTLVQPGSAAHLELDSRVDIDHLLDRIASPCLVIGANEDRWVDVGHSRYVASRVPGSRLVELAAGHLVLNERPTDIAECMASHIGR